VKTALDAELYESNHCSNKPLEISYLISSKIILKENITFLEFRTNLKREEEMIC